MASLDPRFPRPTSLVHMLGAAVEAAADSPALICRDDQVSFRELGRCVRALSRRLEPLGVAGARVLVLMPNGIDAVVAIFAGLTARAQVAPVNPFFKEAELGPMVDVAAPTVILCDETTAEKASAMAVRVGLDPAERVLVVGSPDLQTRTWAHDPSQDGSPESLPESTDLALLLFTGGTTGVPKGVNHTHEGIAWSIAQHCSVWPVDFGGERFLTVTPLFHIWGLAYAAFVPIYAHSTLVMVPRYEPDAVVAALDAHRITIFGGGPAPIYMGLLGSERMATADFSALKYCLSGGAPCPEELHRRWHAATGCHLFEGWGMTEGAPFCLNPAHGTRKILSVGLPVPETVVEAVDLDTGRTVLPPGEAGELRARGPQMMGGYRDNPEETAIALRDGWMYTGDIGYLDDDGYVFIVDRKKEMVIVGGYNVYPRQVEEALFQHPQIREAAVVGKSDPRLGETLVAFVVPETGQTIDRDAFFAYCADAMVKYKRPTEMVVVESLPRTGPGKVNKRALRERLQDL